MKLLWGLLVVSATGITGAAVNDQCNKAIPLSCNTQTQGDTCLGVWDGTADCIVPHTAPQLWYYVDVAAGQLQASLCNAFTDWDTEISIFTGSCQQPVCYDGADDGCVGMLYQSFLSIPAVPAGRYYIMVHGFAASCGTFAIDLACSAVSDSPSPAGRPSKSPPNTPPGFNVLSPNPSRSPVASISPSPKPTPLPSPPINEQCVNALPVTCGATVAGNTKIANFDGTWDCGVVHSAPQVWYYVDVGIGQLQVDTCNAATTWDTQISVYTGADCTNLTCADGVDDGCAAGGMQTFLVTPTAAVARYFIMVHGFGSASGSFSMTVQCTPAPSTSPSMSMSPRSASRSNSPVSASRSRSRSMSPQTASASLSGQPTPSPSGAPSESPSGQASGSASESQSWSRSGSTSRSVSPSIRPSPSPVPSASPSTSPPQANWECPGAFPLTCGQTVYSDTTLCPYDGTWDCVVVHSAPQAWFYVDVGAGQYFQVDTCNAATTWDTQISVYSGLDCTNLTCYDGVDDGCTVGLQSLLAMPATPAGRYYIMVHGFGSLVGRFGLTVQCTPPSPGPSGSMSPVSGSVSTSRSPSRFRPSRSNSPRSASRSTSRSNSPVSRSPVSFSQSPLSASPSPGVVAIAARVPIAARLPVPAETEEAVAQTGQSNNALYGLLAIIPVVMGGLFFVVYRAKKRTSADFEVDYYQGHLSAAASPCCFNMSASLTDSEEMIQVQLAPCPTLDPTYTAQ